MSLSPFLKWAGGKRWLVEKHADLISLGTLRLIEPFVGSGAVFFGMEPSSAILSDKNVRLIESYQAIKDDWKGVVKWLNIHQQNHCLEYYYEIRSMDFDDIDARAAQFIYLNRTCWNGLYRVNKSGQFNVPIGTKQNVLLSTDNFKAVSRALSNVELLAGDFEEALNRACLGDFVFVDPPYTVKHNHNGFVKYNESIFSWDDQIRLRDKVSLAVDRGAVVLVTNACHDSVKSLYKGLGKIITLSRSSVIAGSAGARGTFQEVVIKCY
ncbi:Dam family site-specific DNA-(adenine-N6)-methyltransferase [Acidovorax sp. Leaf78]|uniref:DNA adenine methylase n=1 Tax=Acidovorax sp. Leaf78 TaxID=1736237 RepID=UPI0009E7F8E2|nr:Dam family site-specific DNA-(adenine-N6)-methyltransferase [Acidovorax sp. Leaf78]